VQQFGTPDEVFDDPANLFVAEFVGEPQINVLRGVARVRDGRSIVEIGSGTGALETTVTGVADGTEVTVGVRPQDCTVSARGAGQGVAATVAYFEHLLEFGLATTTVAGIEEGIVVQTPAEESYEPEQDVTVSAPAERVYLFDRDTGDRLR
jgi:ABC-type sugar transport system ATPase subunit